MEMPEDGVSHHTIWSEHHERDVEHRETGKGNIGDNKEKKGI